MSHSLAANRLEIKVFCDPEQPDIDYSLFIPIFHRWIAESTLSHELAIDVADYRHVPNGPLVMLVCHSGHYVIDAKHGTLGLCYNEKRSQEDPLQTRFLRTLASSLQAAKKLEDEPTLAAWRFDRSRIQLSIQDRLLAPNDKSTFDALKDELSTLAATLFGDQAQVHRVSNDPREAFTVTISGVEQPWDVLLKSVQAA